MRPNHSQDSGEQKKSVFDRLGRQLDGGRPVNRRSPAHFNDHQMHPGMHASPEYGGVGGGGNVRYMRGEGHSEIDWRFQNDRRNMPFGRDRHPTQVGPPMPMPMPPPHYDIDSMPPGRQLPPYFQHPQQPPQPHFQPGLPNSGPPPPPPQLMGGPDNMPMNMHDQRRLSPKYDRHGNPIRGLRMDQTQRMGAGRNFMGPPMPGPMMPHGSYDMMPVQPGLYQPGRWHENLEMEQQMHGPRILPDERFMDQMNRFHQQPQAKGPVMMNPEIGGMQPNFEAPRYSKWRERRDAITNLDRQTAQSSSKTDSLKSSLQQPDGRGNLPRKSKNAKADEQLTTDKQFIPAIEAPKEKKGPTPAKVARKESSPRDISDGEIVDDEDSSDDSDSNVRESNYVNNLDGDLVQRQPNRQKPMSYTSRKPLDNQHVYESSKRRRYNERDDCPLDYETISDEELDDFMSEKKMAENEKGTDVKAFKNSSEMELLNALGLDWANLIEMTKQSRRDTQTSDSALRKFSLANYIPTLGITKELAGPVIYDLLMRVVQ